MAFIRAPKTEVTPEQYKRRYIKDTETGAIFPRYRQLKTSYGMTPEQYAAQRKAAPISPPAPVKRIETITSYQKGLETRRKHATAKQIFSVKWGNAAGVSAKQAQKDPMFQAAWRDYLKSYKVKDKHEKARLRRDMLDNTDLPRNWEYYGPGDTP